MICCKVRRLCRDFLRWTCMASTWIVRPHSGGEQIQVVAEKLCFTPLRAVHNGLFYLSGIYMLQPHSVLIFILESTALRPGRQCLIWSVNSSSQKDSQLGWEQHPEGSIWSCSRLESTTCWPLGFIQFIGTLWAPISDPLEWDNKPSLKHIVIVRITK